MVQIAGLVSSQERGVTTIDQHEDKTWGATTGAPPIPAKPLTNDHPTLIAYVKKIRDRRG